MFKSQHRVLRHFLGGDALGRRVRQHGDEFVAMAAAHCNN